MATNSTNLLPSQSLPLAVITSTDERGIVLIVTWLSLIFAVISLIIRAFIRLGFQTKIARDDIAVFAALIAFLLQAVTLFIAVSSGFGDTLKDVSQVNLVHIQKALFASEILYLIVLWLTKCSVAFLYLRLSPDASHTLTSNVVLVTITLFSLISIFIIALRCHLDTPWVVFNGRCTNLLARWEVVAVFDIITEIALFLTSIQLIYGLQSSFKKKSIVVLAFGLRLPIIAPIILRIYFLHQELASADPTLHGVLAATCTQIQLSYAIIAATTPCLRPFMTALSTNYGAPAEIKSPSATKAGSAAHDVSLRSLSKMPEQDHLRDESHIDTPATRWDTTGHHVEIMSGDQHSIESQGSKEMIISKSTKWDIAFESQNHI